MKRPKKKRKGAKRKAAPRKKNLSFRKFKKAAKKRAAARGENTRLVKVHKIRRAVQHRSKKQDRQPNPRKAKTNRWYKGPRGTKIRVRRSRGQFVVDVK